MNTRASSSSISVQLMNSKAVEFVNLKVEILLEALHITPSVPNYYKMFWFSRYIAFTMYLDVVYI